MTRRLLLASASPARLATLRAAGIDPLVEVSDVDEPAVLRELAATRADGTVPAAEQVLALARAKARTVAARPVAAQADVVLGCDSMLEMADGEVVGKPSGPAEAVARWRRMRGGSGVLHTGHWLVRRGDATAEVGATASTTVRFADLTDAEIDAYVATGEPLVVAGAFTVDGLGGPFVEGIEGDYHNVVGVSLPLLRGLLAEVGVGIAELWRR